MPVCHAFASSTRMWDDDLKDKSVTESSPEPRKNSTASKSILRRGISEVITGALKKDQQGHRLQARKSKAQMFAVSRSPRAAKLVVIVIGLAPPSRRRLARTARRKSFQRMGTVDSRIVGTNCFPDRPMGFAKLSTRVPQGYPEPVYASGVPC